MIPPRPPPPPLSNAHDFLFYLCVCVYMRSVVSFCRVFLFLVLFLRQFLVILSFQISAGCFSLAAADHEREWNGWFLPDIVLPSTQCHCHWGNQRFLFFIFSSPVYLLKHFDGSPPGWWGCSERFFFAFRVLYQNICEETVTPDMKRNYGKSSEH